MIFPQILRIVLLDDKLCDLVPFLLHGYQKKEQITMEEMLHTVRHDYCEYFPSIFRVLCESTCLSFGSEMGEVDSPGHTYALVPILGLTYNNGILDNDDQIIPKVDVLIYIRTVIFINGNCVSEEELRKHITRWAILGLGI